MSIRKPIYIPLEYTVEDLFSLNIHFTLRKTKITMTLFGSILTTDKLPATYTVLSKMLPQIFTSKCFNDDKLPFEQEVRRTEVGHLFEHVLLEYLCDYKIAKGFKDVAYSGQTCWNWRKDPYGVFHIYITSGYEDADIFPLALGKTIQLVKAIMSYREVPQSVPMFKEAGLESAGIPLVQSN